MRSRDWTDEQDNLLKDCLKRGLTYAECANEISERLGCRKSRNACCGRASRLGVGSTSSLEHRAERNREAFRKSPLTRKAQVREAPTAAEIRKPVVKREIAPVGSTAYRVIHAIKRNKADLGLLRDKRPLRCDPVEPLKIDLLELTDETCHWPVGGWPGSDPISFCGHPAAPGCSYCPDHKALNTGRGTYGETNAHRVTKTMVAA